ncbi:MAG: double-strand break repair helicase AddA [Roseomonas sp.]|nr:double-strand break repair helicase AddA [Roseomonas sp.]
MSEARQRAEDAQNLAADPTASAWVEASAGSGKTKLLTDRLLRLLLAGVPPGRILCLTFTKAAAAEMATRLALRLGEWVVADDAKLAEILQKLTGHAPGREGLAAARQLFADVLEQPGGMRISTLHGFAQSLLRGFPLEAGLAPQFAVMQEQDGRALLARERDALLAGGVARDALAVLAKHQAPTRFAEVMGDMAAASAKLLDAEQKRHGMAGLRAALARKLGLSQGRMEEAEILAEIAAPDQEAALWQAAETLKGGSTTDQKLANAMLQWLALDHAARAEAYAEWHDVFFTDKGSIRKKYATKSIPASRQADIQQLMEDEAARLQVLDQDHAAARVLAASMALFALGMPVLRRYQMAKENAGLLDYDDLITGASKLLKNPGSAWVLFKLDDGLDHILLDEAQDSNPEQWDIVRALTGEFFAGLGARDEQRSIFAVGDQKQSIYAFQGADAAGFVREKRHYESMVRGAQQEFRAVPLDVSFRSTEPVLALVDAVFAAAPARDGVSPDAQLQHYADRAGHAGSVELWPILQVDKAPPPPDWEPPEKAVDAEGAAPRLAAAIARRIAQMIKHETLPARVEQGKEASQPAGRPIRPGDILVLLRGRKRGGFVPALVRELKNLSIPVGGIDRMVLANELPVQDMLALAAWLLLPDDDLNLAALLKSPLVGLDETQLFTLAQPRQASLHAALMAHRGSTSDFGRVADWLAAQAARLNFITPHGLFADVLGAPGPLDPRAGRARMLARLGPDAGDPLDELLNAALEHEKLNPPSLQGFVHWLRQGGAEVKREAEAAGNVVRIMTVHGAKGLQAPIVILPDTTGKGQDRKTLRWFEDGDEALPVWAPQVKGFEAPALTAQRQADQAREAEEEHRLLYVALTRAEDRLIICGWNGVQKLSPGCWYDLVAQGFARVPDVQACAFDPASLGAPTDAFGAEPKLLRLSAPQTEPPRVEDTVAASAAEARPPAWAWQKLAEEAPAGSLAPSALPGEQETPAAAPRPAQDPLGLRFRRGRLVHALLQSLPEHPEAGWEELSRRFLARRAPGLSAEEQEATLQEVLDLLRQGWMRTALGAGSLAEAPLAGEVNGRLIAGQVDRLKVEAHRVLVLDYKTNRPPPEQVADVAPLYLRQMAAYRALLRAAFPGRVVECALVWTYGARFMGLPDAVLDPHAPGGAVGG